MTSENPALWPPKLREYLETLEWLQDPQERYAFLIELADAFRPVPPEIATPPYPKSHLVPHCESQAYVWAVEAPEGHAFRYYFAVENPQGLSAMAMAKILDDACSGAPAWQVAHLPDDLPQRIFGPRLSMGRTMGLEGMVAMVREPARQHLAACPVCQQALVKAQNA